MEAKNIKKVIAGKLITAKPGNLIRSNTQGVKLMGKLNQGVKSKATPITVQKSMQGPKTSNHLVAKQKGEPGKLTNVKAGMGAPNRVGF
jgi:hypothetical protein